MFLFVRIIYLWIGIQREGRRRADAPLKVWLVDRAGHELGGMKAGRSGQETAAAQHGRSRANAEGQASAAGRSSYGSAAAAPAPFVAYTARVRPLRASSGRARTHRMAEDVDGKRSLLSDVPEEADGVEGEGVDQDERGRGSAPVLQSGVPARMFFSLLAWAVMAPLIVLGPRLGKDALAVPQVLPPHQWGGGWFSTSVAVPARSAPRKLKGMMKGAHLAQISQHGIAKLNARETKAEAAGLGKAVAEAVTQGGGDDLLRTFGTLRGDAVNDGMEFDQSGVAEARIQSTQQGTEIVKVGRQNIWNYGPFVFTLGVMLSVLAKLLIAQPLAKAGTDLLHMWAGAQQPVENPEEYYGYVYLERDEEFGGPTPRGVTSATAGVQPSTDSKRATASTVASTVASQSVTPRHSQGEASAHATPKATHTTPSRARYSAGSRPGSSGKKWAVTLDLPETVPARQSPLTNGVVGTAGDGRGVSASPLPLVSPDTAMTKKGESLVSQLDLGN